MKGRKAAWQPVNRWILARRCCARPAAAVAGGAAEGREGAGGAGSQVVEGPVAGAGISAILLRACFVIEVWAGGRVMSADAPAADLRIQPRLSRGLPRFARRRSDLPR